MGKWGGIIAQGLMGAAVGGFNALAESGVAAQKAQIEKDRDERLAALTEKRDTQQYAHQTELQRQRQEFEGTERASDRELRKTEMEETKRFHTESLKLQGDQLEAQKAHQARQDEYSRLQLEVSREAARAAQAGTQSAFSDGDGKMWAINSKTGKAEPISVNGVQLTGPKNADSTTVLYAKTLSDRSSALLKAAEGELDPARKAALIRQADADMLELRQTLGREVKSPAASGATPAPDHVKFLQSNPTPEAKASFDKKFGPGAADKALAAQKPAGNAPPVTSGIAAAGAATPPTPDARQGSADRLRELIREEGKKGKEADVTKLQNWQSALSALINAGAK